MIWLILRTYVAGPSVEELPLMDMQACGVSPIVHSPQRSLDQPHAPHFQGRLRSVFVRVVWQTGQALFQTSIRERSSSACSRP